jgi:hypothetical protein
MTGAKFLRIPRVILVPYTSSVKRSMHSVLGASLLLFVIQGTAGLAGCDDDDDDHASEGEPTGTVCPTAQTLTYANFGQSFIQTYCLRCHSSSLSGAARMGAPDDHNFDTVEDVRALATHIDSLAGAGPNAVNTAMPDGEPRPSEAMRRQFSEWLTCGAP